MGFIFQTFSSSIGKKMLMAASGSFLGLFILVHVVGNSTSFLGREVFLSYAHHLHSLGFLIPIFELTMLTVFSFHIVLALLLLLENRKARPQRYAVVNSRGGRSLGSKTMIYTGGIILVFVVVHLLNFHFINHDLPIADVVRNTLQQPGYAVFYIVGVLAMGLHISHGFWSLFQSFGIEHPKYTSSLDRKAAISGLMVGLIFALIPVLALLVPGFLL
jgi:succinate dehydrogenase / fumarate reductase, cytochrome b subunit